jgi:predicted AAA+ superfamily ATPase
MRGRATITPETIAGYVGLLQRLFIVEARRPWTPVLRSRARLRTASKLHLVDPALATGTPTARRSTR